MNLSKINNCINPFSKGFRQTIKNFDTLTIRHKIITVTLSTITGLATIFLGGIGGLATFKALTDTFKVEKILKGTNPTAGKIDQLGEKILNGEKEVPQTKTDLYNLSSKELLERSTGFPLQNNSLKLFSSEDEEVRDDQNKLNGELLKRIGEMQKSEQKGLLEQANGNPEKFALVAYGVAFSSPYAISSTCKFLEECDWPSQKLKEQFLPELISSLILEKGIAWDNWESGFVQTGEGSGPFNIPGFYCNRILISAKKIFGLGDFTANSKPVSPYLAKSIGLAIQEAADAHVLELKEGLDKGAKKDLKVGVEVAIAQSMETRFPASMIAPILPYLKDVKGMVSLKLSDVGMSAPGDASSGKSSNGFNNEHAEALLDILRSQPFLQKAEINVDGMSEDKRKAFMDEWTKIWENPDRFQKPSPKKLLAFTENT